MSLRILPRVFPRQSPSEAIRSEINFDGNGPLLLLDVFFPWGHRGKVWGIFYFLNNNKKNKELLRGWGGREGLEVPFFLSGVAPAAFFLTYYPKQGILVRL